MHVPKRMHHVIMKRLHKLGDIPLHKTQIMSLMILKNHEPVTMHELGKRVGMEKGSFTQVVDKLVQSEYAQRNRDQNDRRSVLVSLTPKGVELTDQIEKRSMSEIQKMFSALDTEDVKSLSNALSVLDNIITKIEEIELENE